MAVYRPDIPPQNWLTDSATPDDVNRVTTGKQSRVVKA
jgi:hypothetical protein